MRQPLAGSRNEAGRNRRGYLDVRVTYSDYRRFDVESRIVP